MQTITLRERVGADGILRLQVPHLPIDEEMEAVVVIQPQMNRHIELDASKAWVDELFGCIQDETFVEPEDLPFETREPIE